MQLNLFPDEIQLRRIEPEKNVSRYYAMRIEQDMFGEWCLVREWGRIETGGTRQIKTGPWIF